MVWKNLEKPTASCEKVPQEACHSSSTTAQRLLVRIAQVQDAPCADHSAGLRRGARRQLRPEPGMWWSHLPLLEHNGSMQFVIQTCSQNFQGKHFNSHWWLMFWFCVWVAGALKSRLPRCVPSCLVAVLIAIQLGWCEWCVGRTWWFTGLKWLD